MTIEQLKNTLPECAKDIKLNLSNILTDEGAPDLNPVQRSGIALSCAYSTKNQLLISIILAEVQQHLSENEIEAAKSAAIIMAMNNIYYRFIHLINDKSFSSLPAGLRMSVINQPGIDRIDFEMNCLAVSALNGCGMCIESHTHALIKAEVSKRAIQSAVRIAAVMNAVATGVKIS
ncbi:MAG: ahpD [Gammaproteobacteria bacterium]|jgi:alkyl hydroperoxide reductase subunit D|nr:ahpD [Gammaproteobacteria bacterium]